MSAELHLPDLPEVALSLGGQPAPQPSRMPLAWRLREALASYLPLLLMVALALGTWWLVESTPGWREPRGRDPGRLEADYTMNSFTVQRFAADGRLRLRLDGRELRHFPAGDRIEIDRVRLRAIGSDGRVLVAHARQAVSDGESRVVRLVGGAELVGEDGQGRKLVVRSEELVADLEREVVSSRRPVELSQGSAAVVKAAGLEWNRARRQLSLSGPLTARLQVAR